MRVSSPRYSAQFKSDTVALLASTDRTIPQVSKDLGVSTWTLRAWYKASMAKKASKPASSSPETAAPIDTVDECKRLRQELTAARREIDSLKIDREILKKAAAFFAKENA